MGAEMLMLVVACLAGIFLGLYYNFLVLIPITLAAAAAFSVAAAFHGQTTSAGLTCHYRSGCGPPGGLYDRVNRPRPVKSIAFPP